MSGYVTNALVAPQALAIPLLERDMRHPEPPPATRPGSLAQRCAANTAELAWADCMIGMGREVTVRAVIAATLEELLAARMTIDHAAELLERIQGAGDRLHDTLIRIRDRATMTHGVLGNMARKRAAAAEEA